MQTTSTSPARCSKTIHCGAWWYHGRLRAMAAMPRSGRASAFDLEPLEKSVRLTVTHDELEPDSEMLRGITFGWPAVLASLKTLLETGDVQPTMWSAKLAAAHAHS